MAHGGQKQAFGFVGAVCRLTRLFKRQFDLFMGADVAEGANQYILALVACRGKTQIQVSAIGHFEFIGGVLFYIFKGSLDPVTA